MQFSPKLCAFLPCPNDATNWNVIGPLVAEIFKFESVNRRIDAGSIGIFLVHLGELTSNSMSGV